MVTWLKSAISRRHSNYARSPEGAGAVKISSLVLICLINVCFGAVASVSRGSSNRAAHDVGDGGRLALALDDIPAAPNVPVTPAANSAGATRRLRSSGPGEPAPSVRLVVVNDIAGHFEVLAGVLDRLHSMLQQQQQHQLQPTLSAQQVPLLAPLPRVLYTGNARAPFENGLQDWLGGELVGAFSWHPLNPPAAGQVDAALVQPPPPPPGPSWRIPADLVICVSAELAPKVCRNVLAAVRPRLLVVVVHRADTHTPNARILFLHPAYKLMALAPHVANLSGHMLRRPVDWSMPVAAFTPRRPCRSKKCLKGFSIQGALRRYKSKHGNGFTRDYSGLWRRLLQLRATGQSVPPVVVVGKGLREDLMLPAELEDRVAFHPYLKYPDFWSLIATSYALVPAFGMPVYYESRISSTLLASLATCVPVIAERRLLDTYPFLEERHVFLRGPTEDEAAAMVRIMELPEEEIFARREAVCELRHLMNNRAGDLLAGYIRQAADMAAADEAEAAVAAEAEAITGA